MSTNPSCQVGDEKPEADETDLIEATHKKKRGLQNGDSPTAEDSPLKSDNSGSILCSPQNQGLRIIVVSSIVFSIAVTVALVLTIYLAPNEVSGNASIVAGDKRCADIGLKALKDGGSAVDAAIAAAFCLSVVEPQHSGIGGGGFAIVHDHKVDESYGFDFREKAPAALTNNTLKIPNLRKSVLSTGVPGMVKGLAAMHKKKGELGWKELVMPSVELASSGFLVSKELELSLASLGDPKNFPSLHNFQTRNGKWKEVNDTVILPTLASTLTEIMEDADALYTGSRKAMFAQEIQDQNGILDTKDLEGYTAQTPTVLQSELNDLTVLTLPPPASGPLLSLMLNMAQKYIKKTDKKKVKAVTYHKMIETFKFGFGQLSMLGDPSVEKAVAQEVQFLMGDALATQLVNKISNETNPDPNYYGPAQPSGKRGTSQISVFDSSEVMVSLSLSTGSVFGNKLMLPNTGIFLNDNLAEFSLSSANPPTHDRNLPAANKRPQSSMCPTIVYNKDHPCDQRMVLGAVHGGSILTGLMQVLVNNFMFGQKLSDALKAPRLDNQLHPNITYYEKEFPAAIVKDLQLRGHDMKKVDELPSQVTAVRKNNDDLSFGIDPRSLSAGASY